MNTIQIIGVVLILVAISFILFIGHAMQRELDRLDAIEKQLDKRSETLDIREYRRNPSNVFNDFMTNNIMNRKAFDDRMNKNRNIIHELGLREKADKMLHYYKYNNNVFKVQKWSKSNKSKTDK